MPVWQTGSWTHLDSLPLAVSARPAGARRQRGGTLAQLSAAQASLSARCPGWSPANGVRPSNCYYRSQRQAVPIDELVGAPETGDPRMHPRPVNRHRHDVHPVVAAGRRDPGVQDHHPAARLARLPRQQTHEGYEWMYVLYGRLRLELGDQDLIMTPGEAAEFDTRAPHGFEGGGGGGRPSPGPVRSAG